MKKCNHWQKPDIKVMENKKEKSFATSRSGKLYGIGVPPMPTPANRDLYGDGVPPAPSKSMKDLYGVGVPPDL